ncbi:MAG TPA: L,D-transpeptidase, partial [Thermoanaerobaculia bacterium]|nr:L,D-transpeptidase [Thermoanaerobaculia bacterium]
DSTGSEGDAEPAGTARDRPETDDDAAPVVRMRNTDAPPSPDPAPAADETAASETWNDITPQAFESFAPRFPVSTEDGGPTVLAVQQLLSRVGFSPGVVDGRWGKNTEKALYWLQNELGLEPTGTIDAALYERLRETAGTESPVTTYRVSAEDVAGPFPSIPEDVQEKAALDCLCYSSAVEALAERFRTTPDLLAALNPDADFQEVAAGTEILVPDVEPPAAPVEAGEEGASWEGQRRPSDIAALVISKEGFYLHALDDAGRILYHFPTTVGAGYGASPSETLKVTAIAFEPTFHYQPELFAEVSDDDATALLPPGPNSPVGVVWMQLSKAHYGIHGTAEPATIGYSTSHGCIRLTNWDAQFLAERLPEGVPVMFRGDHPDDAEPADAGEGG